MPLPTFIVIGGMKCGTTSLHHYLGLHPDVGMTHKKEVNYFCERKNWHRGPEWYRAQFPTGVTAYGDISPRYSKVHLDPGVPGRMHDLVPDVRLIYLVRDPVKRFVSHYVHNYAKLRTNLDFSQAVERELDNDGNILQSGRYFQQVCAFLEHFPQERLLVVKSEDLLGDRQTELRRIFEFIGVDAEVDHPEFDTLYNKGSEKLRPNRLGRLFARAGCFGLVWKSRRTRIGRGCLFRSFDRPEVTSRHRERLACAYADSNRQLAEFTGMDFGDWTWPDGAAAEEP